MAARILSPDIARWRACSAQRATGRAAIHLVADTQLRAHRMLWAAVVILAGVLLLGVR